MPTPTRPYAAIPADAGKVLRPVLPSLADEIIVAIAREVPDYARAMEGEFGQVVRVAIERALGRFIDLIEDPSSDDGRGRAAYVDLGRGEMRAGRSLEALLSAYRLGSPPAGGAVLHAGGGGAGRGPGPGRVLRARRVDVRLHRRALGRVGGGLRRGAVGRRRGAPAAPPPPRAPARAGRRALGGDES